jgi:hypothetical protein
VLLIKNNTSISLVHFGLVKLIVIFCFSMHYSYAQQNICVGSITHYKVDELENGGHGTLGSSYQWMVVKTGWGWYFLILSTHSSDSDIRNRLQASSLESSFMSFPSLDLAMPITDRLEILLHAILFYHP